MKPWEIFNALPPEQRAAIYAENEAKAAARCGLSLEDWRAKYGCALGPPRRGTAEQRTAFEAERIAQDEKSGLHPGRHWDGKRWRNLDGSRVVLPPVKPFEPEAIEAARQRAQGVIDRGLAKFEADPTSVPPRSDFTKQANKRATPIGPAVHSHENSKGWIVVKWDNVIGLIKRFGGEREGVFAVEFALLMPICIAALGWAIDIGQTMQIKQATQFAALASASVGGRSLNQQGGAIAAATLAVNKTFTANASLFMLGATPVLGTIQAYDATGAPTTQDAAATSIDVTVSASAPAIFPLLVGPTISQTAEARS